ncbi:MAG TPA: HEAT repeat domain-containing protein [Candidatus Acidoferrum sp.]|nr:HEAT repeat domain-containing protein [Candidatus Acidoferrum sp.]
MRNTNRKSIALRDVLGSALIVAGVAGLFIQSSTGHAWPRALPSQGAAASPGQPRIENAKLETHALSGSLEAAIREFAAQADSPLWLGYTVDQIAGDGSSCCGNSSGDGQACGTCRLEKENGASINSRSDASGSGTISLEGPRRLAVLYRLAEKRVSRIRIASPECTLDAGGLRFIWLAGVKPAESIAVLSGYVETRGFSERSDHHLGNEALTAIALHADPSSDRALEDFVSPQQPEHLRRQTAFWLGAARGKAGLSLLERMAKDDPSPEVRSQVAFALSVSKEPAALEDMIRMAHGDTSAHVRGQALFWLAQKASEKAAGTITGAIENDPDTQVKRQAVFALSQLPKDEGVPRLIAVAENNRNPEVRKQAMFWLGQSNDPRALDFFAKILGH